MTSRPPIRSAVWRGFRRRCPRCGRGPIFTGWYTVRETCSACGLRYEPGDGDTWGFMYLSTGFITGLLIITMLVFRPTHVLLGQVGLAAAVIVFMLGTLPNRKGVAIALDYLANHHWAHPDDREDETGP